MDEWKAMPHFIENLKRGASKNYMIAGGFIAMEPHRNTTLYSKRGKNTKAGRPHIHMVLWFYNHFMMPDVNFFTFDLQALGLNVKAEDCETHLDTLKTVLYTIKDAESRELLKICQQVAQVKTSVEIWANNPDSMELFQQAHMQMARPSIGFSFQPLCCHPSVRQHTDHAITLAELFAKYFQVPRPAFTMALLYQTICQNEFNNFWNLLTALESLGSTFHPGWKSKKAAGVYLHGPSDTFKSTLINVLLQAVRPDHIDTLPRTKGQFNIAPLKKDGKTPYLWFNDDARWQDLSISTPELLNLLDGAHVTINRKFLNAQTERLLGSIVFTSNHSLDDLLLYGHNASQQDVTALEKRMRQVKMHPVDSNISPIADDIVSLRKHLEQEAVGLAILANAYFLQRNPGVDKPYRLPNSWMEFHVVKTKAEHDKLDLKSQGVDMVNRVVEIIVNQPNWRRKE